MRLVSAPDGLHLEHEGVRVRLEAQDRVLMGKMTPLGRKVYFARKSKVLGALGQADQDAEILWAWSKLPAREWAFPLSRPDPA